MFGESTIMTILIRYGISHSFGTKNIWDLMEIVNFLVIRVNRFKSLNYLGMSTSIVDIYIKCAYLSYKHSKEISEFVFRNVSYYMTLKSS